MSTARITAALRRRIAEASRYRCGYCQTSQRIIGPLLEIDHIVPESRGGTDDERNLILACPLCNGHKADKIESPDPQSGLVVPLFNPREHEWRDHFQWGEDGTVIRGQTAIGRATVLALAMNHPDVVLVRELWVSAGWHPPTDQPA